MHLVQYLWYPKYVTSYTKNFKKQVVLDYLNGGGSYDDLAIKYHIPSSSPIKNWVKLYNSHIELKDYIPEGEDIYMAKSRKVNKEERIEIVKYCLEHDMDYKITAKLFETTYANVFNWVKKYKEKGEDGLGEANGTTILKSHRLTVWLTLRLTAG